MTGRRAVSATVRRRRLGAELRRHREAAGLTIDLVADHLDCSSSKISRVENGQIGSRPRDVREMLLLYQVEGREFEDLIEVARGTRERGWWQPYGSVLTSAYVGFEAAAESIRSYEAQCVPGLLQTEEYARALTRAGRLDISPEEIDRRIRVRMARQALLTQEEPVEFWCVIDEGVLRRQVGGADIMRRQLERLGSTQDLPSVTLQVLPFDAGAHAGMEGSFVLLRFDDAADPDTVYVTLATGGVFQEKPNELERYAMIFDRIQELALPPEKSLAFVAQLAEELG